MDDTRRESKRFSAGLRSPGRGGRQGQKGFAGLDPTHLGLDAPDWLPAASPLPAESDVPIMSHADASAVLPPGDEAPPLEALATSRTLLEGMKVVCICKGIRKSVFWKALDSGAQTKEEVNRLTGSGSGGCKGRRCGPRILEMLRDLSP